MTDDKKKDDAVAEEATEEKKEDASSSAEATEDKPAEDKKEENPSTDAQDKKAEVAPEPEPEKEVPAPSEVEVEMTADQKKVVDMIEKMTVLELNALVKVFEEKFGVSAAAVAVAGGGAGADESAEEKSSFVVHLTSFGESKIGVIKIVKEVLGLGLKEAKDLVESAPVDLKSDVKKEEAEEWKTKFEAVGAAVELK